MIQKWRCFWLKIRKLDIVISLMVSIRRHRIEGALSFGVSTISRSQVLPNYERVWEQTIVEEAYQQAIVELLEQGEVVLRVED
ncbi:hypothetical protein OC7_01455 [Vibrio cyclitrophicus ZF270]|nr:hypothetical protein OC7_01455 [Vibrio cyclitrophicus ZF270]